MQRGYLNNEVASERKASHDEEVKKRELCHEVLHFRLDRNQLSEPNRGERLFGEPVVNVSCWKIEDSCSQWRTRAETPIQHNTILLSGLRGPLIGSTLCRETSVSRTVDIKIFSKKKLN